MSLPTVDTITPEERATHLDFAKVNLAYWIGQVESAERALQEAREHVAHWQSLQFVHQRAEDKANPAVPS